MRLASWIVTSHHRPELLMATLEHLREGQWPAPWSFEIVVAHAAGDRQSADIAHRAGAIVVPTTEPHPSGKRNAALRECCGELVMTTDDDDFQSPFRPLLAVQAYEAGWQLSGIREFRRLHLASGMVVRYCGRGRESYGMEYPDIPPVVCGTARNYAKPLLDQHHGWNARLPNLEDHELHRRITRRRGGSAPVAEYDFGDALATTTIITQHGGNIFDRPEIARGERLIFGDYLLVGEGHWTQAPEFPDAVAQRLVAIGRL